MADYLKTVVEVTCPSCHETYNIRTEDPLKKRNCRCSKITFEVHLGVGREHVSIYYIDNYGGRYEFENWRIVSQ